jgi:hypothetical protein
MMKDVVETAHDIDVVRLWHVFHDEVQRRSQETFSSSSQALYSTADIF